MTSVALTKLLILVILVFIICLPEFFTSYRALRVNFHCVPYDPCEEGGRERERVCLSPGPETTGNTMGPVCPRTGAGTGNWTMNGTGTGTGNWTVNGTGIGTGTGNWNVNGYGTGTGTGNWTMNGNGTGTGPSDGTGAGTGNSRLDSDSQWLLCEAEVDLLGLRGNASISGGSIMVSVFGSLNLTLYGHLNTSTLSFRSPEEEKERDEEDQEEGQRVFYCCLPAMSNTTHHSRCLLHLTNEMLLKSAVSLTHPPQRNEWSCRFRVMWLVLLSVVALIALTMVLGQVCRERRCCHLQNPMLYPVNVYQPSGRLNAIGGQSDVSQGTLSEVLQMHTERATPNEELLSVYRSSYWRGLSPIYEDETAAEEDPRQGYHGNEADFTETLLDGDMDSQKHDMTGAHLHHRGHPPLLSLSPEDAL